MPELGRAAIWCAVSSEDQADPDLPSLDEQEAAGIAAWTTISSVPSGEYLVQHTRRQPRAMKRTSMAWGKLALYEEWHRSLGLHGEKLHLEGVNLLGVHLAGVDLGLAILVAVVLDNADLSGADLGASILSSSSLRGADLSGAKLCDARLR